MLAETSSDSRRGVSPIVAGVSVPLPFAGDQPQRFATDPSVERQGSGVPSCPPCEESGSIPRVTLPHLKAILEHSGGMSATEVSEVCEFVLRTESCMQQEKPGLQQQQQPALVSGAEGIGGVGEELAVGVEGNVCFGDNAEGVEKRKPVADDKGGRGAAAAVDARPAVETAKTNELPNIGGQDNAGTVGEREDLDTATVPKIGRDGVIGEYGTAVEKPPHGEPLTISFATVCDCEAVRAWVRKGAFTLPSFDVTSGRRRDGDVADRVVTP